MKKNSVFLLMCSTLAILLLSGCFGIGKDSVKLPVGENGESISISGDEDEGFSFEAEGADGESFSVSSSKEIPEAFPDDIPFADEYEIISTTEINQNGEQALTVSYLTSTSSMEELTDLYMSYKENQGLENTSEMKTEAYSIFSMQNDDYGLNINIATAEAPEISVTITYMKKAEKTE
ncbi:hypothetical protein [Radiobacillus sp. PE A8.2]|uniref:hypothetical protein n=1 Tax=Radiobacillus sp. PE A8.2 TaxID=3380349 RepID=UPI003890067D